MSDQKTLSALMAEHPADDPAIGEPGRDWLSYGQLRALSEDVRRSLRAAGVARGDRVAIVLNNGPEMATAFVTVAQAATAAPLNPNYRQEEYEFYLSDLNAKAIIVAEKYDGPALEAANTVGTSVFRLIHDIRNPAGYFQLRETVAFGADDDVSAAEDDVALILHTSGTTSRPKIVPLLQSNVFASAHNIQASLDLTPKDCCLNIMPLFHIHGLIAAVMATLAAGARVSCTPGFNALRFFGQLDEVRPSWYTAVPTMHQAILSRATRNSDVIANSKLRFIRSSSASLPAPVMKELVDTLGVPVIEAYGMTEASHQMCCNPLPPSAQKPGAVGIAAGPEVQIAHEDKNEILSDLVTGEIVISGDNVTPGYESNPAANESSFFEALGKRWFRTGDQGSFDSDGYLFLTGRLKEIINRGGEKISPLEVDAVLLDHPEIAQAICFAVPHPKLGEDIFAAVVLSEGSQLEQMGVRGFAAERLADFKVPRKVVILDEIPKGATGKIQRIGLAQKLGVAG
jgi:acyl-CoA synthetase (AMP-forming)/AMP-acid ligase II